MQVAFRSHRRCSHCLACHEKAPESQRGSLSETVQKCWNSMATDCGQTYSTIVMVIMIRGSLFCSTLWAGSGLWSFLESHTNPSLSRGTRKTRVPEATFIHLPGNRVQRAHRSRLLYKLWKCWSVSQRIGSGSMTKKIDRILYSFTTPGTTDDNVNVSRCSDNTDDALEEHAAEDGGKPEDDSHVVFGAGTQYRPVPGSCDDAVPVDLGPDPADVVLPMPSRLRKFPRSRPRLCLAPPRRTTVTESTAVIDLDTPTEGIYIIYKPHRWSFPCSIM